MTKDGFFIYEFEDETSMSDPKGKWVGGCEYWSRTYRIWVPTEYKDNQGQIDDYIDRYGDDYDLWLD